jgi:hypothetical protein
MLNISRPLDRKERFLREIKGSQVIIPDLYELFPGWKFNINKNYEAVKKQTDIWLERWCFLLFSHHFHAELDCLCLSSWVENDSLRHRMQIANFPKLGACLYPDALEEECLMMSYYHLWVLLFIFISYSLMQTCLLQVFLWDDGTNKLMTHIVDPFWPSSFYPELDCGPLTNDPQKALAFKKATDIALDYTLGEQPFNGQPPPMAPVMTAFSDVAEKVVAGATTEARQRVLSELKFYVDGACILPFHRNNGKMDFLTVKGFLEQREASGGAGASIALIL